ncbi:MAG: hypothetical protein QOJ16_1385 [Acidobacteriota bacterium]|jgi:hypothetical protein|nr:hypothetical protein [Acidobacteriota bacterium]
MSKHCHGRQGNSLFNFTSPRGRFAAVLLFLFCVPLGLSAAEPLSPVRAAGPGERIVAPDFKSAAELVTLDGSLTPRLLALAPEASLTVTDWPVAPEVRRDVVLTRHEVYSPEAKIFRMEGGKRTEVPRSGLAFYWGTAADDDQVRVFLSLDPATGEMQSFTQSRDGMNELRPAPGSAKPGQHIVAPPEALVDGATTEAAPKWSCGEEEAMQDPTHTAKALRSILGAAANAAPPFTNLHTAILAVDTDNELLSQKFGDSTAAAASYVASLIAAMNVMYERDLHVRLLQGTTFLRVSSTPDPYVQGGGGNADGNELNEFSSYWQSNNGNIPRAVAMMLSGKQSSTNQASGIAWISGLCSQSSGYSFSQVFKISYLAGDASVVGHEIGHNFGSPHTHCYSPPADNCFNGESGCYSGGTSCPAPQTINGVTGVVGTVMSYCQFAGCNPQLVFHPRSLTEYINSNLAAANNVCVLPLNTAPTVAAITPRSGTTLGGTPVVLTGSNFQNGATVAIGGVPATGVSVAGNTITATAGAHATGTVSVSVTNPDNSSGTLSNSYFYAQPSGALSFYSVPPCRLVDTRNPVGPLGGPSLGAGNLRVFTAIGSCGIPAGAKSLSANVTVSVPTAAGFLGFYPGNAFPMGTSSLTFSPGQTRASNTMIELSTDGLGTLGVQNGAAGNVDLIVDVNGYFK